MNSSTMNSSTARPSRPRLVLLLAVPVSLAVGALAVVALRSSAPPASEAVPVASSADDVQRLQGELSLLRRQVQVMARQQTGAATPGATGDKPAAAGPPPLTEEEVSARDRRRFEGLARKLAAEPIDRSWAPATERLIADTLKKPIFAGSKLVSTACHSTLCRFEVLHDSDADRRKFSSALPNRLPSLPSGSMRNAEGNERKTIVYVAREGHQVPRDEVQ